MENTQYNKQDKYSKAFQVLHALDDHLASLQESCQSNTTLDAYKKNQIQVYRDALGILTNFNSLLEQNETRKEALKSLSDLNEILTEDQFQIYRDAIKVFTNLDDHIKKHASHQEEFRENVSTLDDLHNVLNQEQTDQLLTDDEAEILRKIEKMPFIEHF